MQTAAAVSAYLGFPHCNFYQCMPLGGNEHERGGGSSDHIILPKKCMVVLTISGCLNYRCLSKYRLHVDSVFSRAHSQ